MVNVILQTKISLSPKTGKGDALGFSDLVCLLHVTCMAHILLKLRQGVNILEFSLSKIGSYKEVKLEYLVKNGASTLEGISLAFSQNVIFVWEITAS